MANSILFRWDDSPTLQHHCGFCARPLNHPGTRNSCLGTHAEPCPRFHQALHMRNRAHLCASCKGTDEAHYKRHLEICEKIRLIYEINGEDGSLIPTDVSQRDNARDYRDTRPPDEDEDDRSCAATDDRPTTRKQRKKAKKLEKAASRRKVITLEEIEHIGSMLHQSSGDGSDILSPMNYEEIDEIEKNLRYNANVYNAGISGQVLRHFGKIRDADVDFGVEMDRILQDIRVNDILKRNMKNRGLQGKDLKTFESLVAELKRLIVEDLVSVKRDEMETRMRRAAYLRYANRTSFGILEDRYMDKDWSTGERILTADSESPTPQSSFYAAAEIGQENAPPSSTNKAPDIRHLIHRHKKLGSGGKIEDVVFVKSSPLATMSQAQAKSKPAVITLVPNGLKFAPRPSHQKSTLVSISNPPPPPPTTWVKMNWPAPGEQLQPLGEVSTSESLHLLKDVQEAKTTAQVSVYPSLKLRSTHIDEEPGFSSLCAEYVGENVYDYPPVSQKKAKKKQREAKRKERKKATEQAGAKVEKQEDQDDDWQVANNESSRSHPDMVNGVRGCESPRAMMALKQLPKLSTSDIELRLRDVDLQAEHSPSIFVGASRFPFPPTPPFSAKSPVESQSAAFDESVAAPDQPLITAGSRHAYWMKDMQQLKPDTVSDPLTFDPKGCVHAQTSTCPFESSKTPDCPFHVPCCVYDPFKDQCYLAFPAPHAQFTGPHNRLRAERMLSELNARTALRDRLMIIDSDTMNYFSRRTDTFDDAPPKRLLKEYTLWAAGHEPGRLMIQERDYANLYKRNKIIRQQFTSEELSAATKAVETSECNKICYCEGSAQEGDTVDCTFTDCSIGTFHKECLKKSGLDRVTKWYCSDCDAKIEKVASQLLKELKMGDELWEILDRSEFVDQDAE